MGKVAVEMIRRLSRMGFVGLTMSVWKSGLTLDQGQGGRVISGMRYHKTNIATGGWR